MNQSGDALASIELNDAVFNVPMNQSLVHQAMVIYQGNKRQGTHDTKTRAQVSGGGRKPWIQKHTGRTRQGSTRAPQWRHGGVVFGPHPRSYRAALPKRMKRQALRCVLSDKARQDRLVCLDSTSTINGKTRSMSELLDNLSVAGSVLMVTMGTDRDVVLAASNIKKIWTLPANQLNAQELLARDTIIMTVEAVRWVEEALASEPHGRRGAKWNGISGNASVVEVTVVEPEEPPEVATETIAEIDTEETPKPRRRRSTAAKPEAANETEGVTPKPRVRRRRAATASPDEPAAEAPETAPASPEEEA